MIHSPNMRLIALVLVVVLTVIAATPVKAAAVDPNVLLAIAGVATAGLAVIAYLIVANVEGGKSAESERAQWMACSYEGNCSPVPASATSAPPPPALALPAGDASQGS
jgi:hypothetical protein